MLKLSFVKIAAVLSLSALTLAAMSIAQADNKGKSSNSSRQTPAQTQNSSTSVNSEPTIFDLPAPVPYQVFGSGDDIVGYSSNGGNLVVNVSVNGVFKTKNYLNPNCVIFGDKLRAQLQSSIDSASENISKKISDELLGRFQRILLGIGALPSYQQAYSCLVFNLNSDISSVNEDENTNGDGSGDNGDNNTDNPDQGGGEAPPPLDGN